MEILRSPAYVETESPGCREKAPAFIAGRDGSLSDKRLQDLILEEPQVGASEGRSLVVTTVMIATGMTVLDSTIANVALPHIQSSLETSQDQIAWVLTSYIIAAGIATPTAGWLTARLGRKRLLVVLVAGFTIASGLCGLAQTLVQMIVFRFLQGACGAVLPPLSQAILADVYPGAERAKGMTLFAVGTMVVPVFGPTLGGWITDAYDWRWVFYINLPVGVLTIFGAILFVPDTNRIPDRKLDWAGFGFLALSIGALQLLLGRGQQKGWFSSSEILIEAAARGLGLYLYVVHASTTARNAFIDVRIFADRFFVTAAAMMALGSIVLFGTQAIIPEMLQSQLNYPVVSAGWLMAPRGIGMMAMAFFAGRLAPRIDQRVFIGTGFGLLGVTYFMMDRWSLSVGSSEIMWLALAQGAAMGVIFPPLMTMPWTTLAPELRSEASGLYSLFRNLGASIGITVISSETDALTQFNHAHLAEFMSPYRHLWSAPKFADKSWLLRMNIDVTREASMLAEINVFWLLGVISLCCMPFVLFVPVAGRPARAGLPVTE